MREAQLSGVGSAEVRRSRAPVADLCQHRRIREIGQDFDENGKLLRLERCQRCGLLMREYIPIV